MLVCLFITFCSVFFSKCTKCKDRNYIGDPKDGNQCYKNIDNDLMEKVELAHNKLSFFAVSPTFTNVRIRIGIDVLVGGVEIFIVDENDVFQIDKNGTQEQLLVDKSYVNSRNNRRRKRDATSVSESDFLNSRSAHKDRITTFLNYESGFLKIYGVEKRLVIQIDHSQHNLSKKKFYFAIRSANRTGQQALFNVYFRQDLPRIDLLLFFLVLTVILLFILSGFIIGMKLRVDFVRNTQNQIQQIELNAMQSRPLASYPLLFTAPAKEGGEVVNNDNDVVSGGGGNSKKKNATKTNEHRSVNKNARTSGSSKAPRLILPLSVQETDDKLAAVVSTIIQLPSNETSEWNLTIGTGLCLVQNQHLIQVRTSTTHTVPGGKRLQTRIHATQIDS